ncbi:MAG: MotA/TolQ/ExbB proton channel family protein [Treponema sp.]|nr:MotA/TolQ/ExbB proton channel family protein [Treponema sp.]
MGLILKGGLLMLPIIVCGLVATYIIIERIVFYKNIRKSDEILKKNIDSALRRNDYADAETFCEAASTPSSNVLKKAIEMRSLKEADLREIVQAEMDNQVPALEHSLTMLGTIANISTLLGLFGTVVGNIQAFGVMGASENMDPSALAGSIAVALLTTAAGLTVAIPSMIFNNVFNRRVAKETAKMESVVTEFVLKLTGRLS